MHKAYFDFVGILGLVVAAIMMAATTKPRIPTKSKYALCMTPSKKLFD